MASARELSGWTKQNSLSVKPGPECCLAIRIEAKAIGISQSALVKLIIEHWYGLRGEISTEEQRDGFLYQAQQSINL